MHKIEGLIDFIQRHRVGNKWLQFNFTLHGIFYHGRKLRTAFHSAESRTFPYAPGNELEWTGGYLLPGAGHADDNGLAPATVSTFQRRTHNVDVTDTFKSVVNAPFVDFKQHIFNRFVMVVRVDAVGCTELTGKFEFGRVGVDSDNASCFCLASPLNGSQTDCAKTKNSDRISGCTFAVL